MNERKDTFVLEKILHWYRSFCIPKTRKLYEKEKNDEPAGKLTKVNDFLPTPKGLLKSLSTKKVTISLD